MSFSSFPPSPSYALFPSLAPAPMPAFGTAAPSSSSAQTWHWDENATLSQGVLSASAEAPASVAELLDKFVACLCCPA